LQDVHVSFVIVITAGILLRETEGGTTVFSLIIIAATHALSVEQLQFLNHWQALNRIGGMGVDVHTTFGHP
jgi:hypothetical protein